MVEQLRPAVDIEMEEHAKTRKALQQANHNYQSLLQDHRRLQDKHDAHQRAFNADRDLMANQVVELQGALATQNNAIRTEYLQAWAEEKQQLIHQFAVETHVLGSGNAELVSARRELLRENQRLAGEVATRDQYMASQEQKLQQLSAENVHQQNLSNPVAASNTKLTDALATALKQIERLEIDKRVLEEDKKRLESQIIQMNEQMGSVAMDCDELGQNVYELEGQLEVLQAERQASPIWYQASGQSSTSSASDNGPEPLRERSSSPSDDKSVSDAENQSLSSRAQGKLPETQSQNDPAVHSLIQDDIEEEKFDYHDSLLPDFTVEPENSPSASEPEFAAGPANPPSATELANENPPVQPPNAQKKRGRPSGARTRLEPPSFPTSNPVNDDIPCNRSPLLLTSDIRSNNFVSPELGLAISREIQEIVGKCDVSRGNWENGDSKAGIKCIRQFSHRHSTEWREKNEEIACFTCFKSGRLCIGMVQIASGRSPARLQLLPRYKEVTSAIAMTDRAYWAKGPSSS